MINFTFTAWPEMLAWPYLILHGWLPYKDIAIAHNPLLLLDLVIYFNIFGVGITQLKIFTWFLIFINTLITYFVAKKYWTKKIGLLSAILYVILCLVYQGNGLWFDLALTPSALLLYFFVKEKRYADAGMFFAFGFLTKQTFIYFLIPVLYYLIKSSNIKKHVSKFMLGFGFVMLIFIAIMAKLGILNDYYNWAIKFGILYLPSAVGQIQLPNIMQLLFALAPFAIFIFGTELLPWAIVGAIGTYPRWELFHFQPALPFLAIAISIFIFSKNKKIIKYIVSIFVALFLCLGISRVSGNNTRFYESDVTNVSNVINASETKQIYVINYWDNVYALTNTVPATRPLIPYIPWYLNYGNSKEMILSDLKVIMPDTILIGERDKVFPELYTFVDRFYMCNDVEKKIELCSKNK